MLSAKEAAIAVGMSKAGIIRAIHTGKLSATRNTNQQFVIDPAELFRVYDPVSTTDNLSWQVADNSTPTQSDPGEKLAMLERIIRDKDDVIADLRGRLDEEAEERRRLTLILTDKSQQSAPRSWWQRLFSSAPQSK